MLRPNKNKNKGINIANGENKVKSKILLFQEIHIWNRYKEYLSISKYANKKVLPTFHLLHYRLKQKP